MRIYLDNCSYNRPYDDQTQMRIHMETEAKLHVQNMVKQEKLELVTSYILNYENSNNRSIHKRDAIDKFMKEYSMFYVSTKSEEIVTDYAQKIMKTGIKEKDAYYVACVVVAGCAFFITTDDRLLKYQDDNINLITPGEFIRKMEGNADD